MAKSEKFLGLFERPSNLGATIVTLLTANWAVVMSIMLGIIGAIWGFARDLALRPEVEIGIAIFLVVLWTYIGLSTITRRNKAQLIKTEQDFAYGLTFLGVSPVFEPNNNEASLQFGITFTNFSAGAIKYTVEELDVRLQNRTLAKKDWSGPSAVMARGAGRTSKQVPFPREAIAELIGRPLVGTLTFSIVYGHPEREPVRRLKMGLTVYVTLREFETPFGLAGHITYTDSIETESDEPITPE